MLLIRVRVSAASEKDNQIIRKGGYLHIIPYVLWILCIQYA